LIANRAARLWGWSKNGGRQSAHIISERTRAGSIDLKGPPARQKGALHRVIHRALVFISLRKKPPGEIAENGEFTSIGKFETGSLALTCCDITRKKYFQDPLPTLMVTYGAYSPREMPNGLGSLISCEVDRHETH
jgi:hypothetical protein